ncbi:Ig-like domain-containing protein [Enterobacter hormaechei]|uniref:Ig-like domain-containing protein n=1 Tax=Enterobacter hormaechei TaxID=158836 RepID=UPI00292A273D|nr:Ig-like domain-containing protein [Enterobacter hormaechei]MDV0400611.1 Ig-like domain-containing protein [Enterobacter hormaechei]
MKIKLALLIAFAGFSAGASAEIAEFSFKDTLNVKKTVSPASVWINPVTSFDVAVISGLDRYITLSLLKSDGSLIWSTKSSLVTVDDRTTSSTGFDYYGKTLTVPAMGEDSFTLREVITDLQGKEVSRQDYPLAIDRTPPATGTISYTRNGWNFGSEAIFTSVPAGMQYASVQALVFNGLSDKGSGLANAEYFITDAAGVERKKPAEINTVEGSVTVQVADASSNALAPENRSEYKVGIYLYDKAGNRSELSRRSVIDRVKPDDIIQVQDATTGSWVSYQSGMTVFQNPISVRVLRKKSDFTAVNGSKYGWADSNFQTSDSTYNIYTFKYIYQNVGDTYHEFQTLAGGVRRIHHNSLNFTPAPAMEIAPKIVAKEMYRSDTSEWLTQASISVKTATISRIKVTAEPRPYVQKFRTVKNAAWFCTIPVGQSSCEMTVNFNYTSDKGFEYLHLYSGKDGDSIFDALAGNFTVIWDNNPPVVNVAQVNKASKTITMTATDNDRVNAWNISYWDTKVFEATLKNARGETFTLKPVTVSESDYKTKNATFSYAGLPDGDYTVVSVSATDLVGNTGTKTLNAPLKIDSTLPVIAFSFNGADAEGKLVKGLENLRISVTDASGDASLISLQLAGGPNSEKVTLAFTPLSKDVFIPEYPRIFPNTDESGQMYHLEALAIDESGNRTTKTLNFTYQPANLIMLDNLKTLATAVALKATDNTPLAIIRTSVLRRQDGSIITGQLNGTLTVQKNAQFGVTVAGVTVQPGETKSLSLDLGNGEERTYPVTPAVSGQSGTATFTIEFPQT